jgi:DNA end-binding protein Ku
MMSARAMWKGVLRLGSSQIPVKLYSAVQDRTVHFHILESKSEARVRQQMVAPQTEQEQPDRDVQKGYEIEPGTFVVVKPKELQTVEPPPSRDIVPLAFVPADKIGPQWYERPYYLAPSEDPSSYFALVDALENRKRAGIAQWVMRKRQYYGALCPVQGSLVLIAMRNSEEVLSPRELPAPGRPPDSRELPLAEQLIKALEDEFHPEEFHDEYRERVQTFLDQKAKGRAPKLKAVRPKKPPESVLDALAASLKAVKKKGKAVA